MFITCIYYTMNKSQLRLQNWLRQTCNVFVVTFKQRAVLHIGCLVEKKINHIVLLWTIKFNVQHIKQKPLEVCITWKNVGFLELYIFPGYKDINMLRVMLHTINNFTYYSSFIFPQKVFHLELPDLVLPNT